MTAVDTGASEGCDPTPVVSFNAYVLVRPEGPSLHTQGVTPPRAGVCLPREIHPWYSDSFWLVHQLPCEYPHTSKAHVSVAL